MRVLHFTQTLPGGPATFLNELLAFQSQAYEKVMVVCPSAQRRLIESEKVKVLPLEKTGRTPGDLLAMHQALRRHLRANRYDVIHLHSSFAGAVGRLLPRDQSARVAYCAHGWAHGMDVGASRKLFYAGVERTLASRTDVIINVSESEQHHAAAAKIPSTKCRVIYNGIRDAPWAPLATDGPAKRLLFVGRYDRQKGLDLLLRSMRELAKQEFSLTAIGAHVIGSSPAAPLPEGVRDLGWQSREVIRREMQQCDLVVMPSRWEGFPFVAIEAMRAGRAVVATRVGGLSECVVDGRTGALCAPNSPHELTDAIRRAAAMAREAGIEGRARYERLFTAERMFHETHAAYVQ